MFEQINFTKNLLDDEEMKKGRSNDSDEPAPGGGQWKSILRKD
jgi:hypothetical protein